ncbi:hypothetical protein FA13DRAFT_1076790 [Coprinellus micaceus]|uniref:Nephrocystin 3-like N-terminal domain-containing protein n=1 Tax=Coprinellus micaceus TaxID=71717 RepID=A0A4Y7TRZ6_COPMI|nr:hypothetical protein FA13DRAFT_1076790 [Coprinellus micaceus]
MSGQRNEYLEGSREDTVQYVLKWGKEPTSELSLLIHGAAGLGKSTLAHHLTHRLHAAGCLAASVSLNALPSDSRGPESVVKLASREIGEAHPGAISSILEAIKSCKGAPLVDLFKQFIVEPVQSLGLPHPLIVLFDSIDEWESHAALIKAISSLASSITSVKFILLGRSDPQARGFEDFSVQPYPLQPISTSVMVQYLEKQFDTVKWESGRRPAPWRIIQLAKLANGLFIWATVVCSILQKRLSRLAPEDILDSILTARRGLGDSEQLATLYYQAIMWLFPDPEGRDLFREYMAATLALQEPLPTADFARLTNLPTRTIDSIQVDLKALQIWKPNDGEGTPTIYPARTLFHQSLLDYLESPSTPSHLAFRIPLLDAHDHLAQCCLTVLPPFLSSSHAIDPLGLSPGHSYAIKYLVTHVHHGTPSPQPSSAVDWPGTRLCKQLEQFGSKVLFRWGALLVCLVKPGSAMEEVNYMDIAAERLMREVAGVLWPDPELGSFRISCLEVAVRLQHENAVAWNDLGWGYYEVAQYSKDIDAGEKAVQAHQNALDIVDKSRSSDRGAALFSLATSLHKRFELIGTTLDLDRSISLHREALDLRPLGHKDRAMSLNNLAVALGFRLAIVDTIDDINEVIHLQREALELRPPGHVDRALSLLNLANTFRPRFQKTASIADLDECILLSREAVRLRPPGHPDRAPALRILADALQSRSQAIPSTTDLDEVVQLVREVLDMCPPGHVDRVPALRGLASSLHLRFQTVASTVDLNEVVQLLKEALDLCPPGHVDRVPALRRLAHSLSLRFQTMASIIDLEESIHRTREALGLCPPGHADRSDLLNELAWNLTSRYEAQGVIQDLHESISLGQESLTLFPVGHPDRCAALDTLAKALHFQPEHLDEALQLSRESTSLSSPSNEGYLDILMTLATILLRHHEHSGVPGKLEEAISVCTEALSLCPPNHLLRPKLLGLRGKLDEGLASSLPAHSFSPPQHFYTMDSEFAIS